MKDEMKAPLAPVAVADLVSVRWKCHPLPAVLLR